MSASSLRRLSPGSTTTATTTTAAVAMIDDDIDLGNIEDILRESAEQEEASMISGSSATGGGGGGASSGSPFSSSGRDPTSRSATSDYISAFAANGTLDDKPYCNNNPSTATTTSTASAFTANLLPGGIGSSSNTATASSRPLLPSSWSGGLSDATATSTTTTPTGGANNANKTTTMKATTTTTTTAAGGGGGVKSQMQVTSKPFFPSTAAPAWSSASPSSPSAATQHNTSNNSTSYSTRSYVSADGGGNNAGGNGGGGHWNGHHHRDPNSPASEGGNSHTAAAAGRSQWSNNNNGYNGNNGTSSSHHHHQHYNNNGSSHNSSLNMSGSAVRGGGGGGSTTATPSHYRSGVSSMNNSSYMMTSHHDRSGTSNRNGDGGATNASSLSGTPIPHHRGGGGGGGTPTSSHYTAREPIPFETYLPFEGIKYWAADHFCVVINNLEPKTTSRHLNTMFFPLGAVDAVAFAMPIGEEDTFRMYQGRKGGVAMFSTAEIGQMAAEKIDDFVPNGQTQPLRTFYFGRYEDYAKRGKNAFYVRIRDNLTVKNPDLWRNIDILCVTFQEAIGFSEEEATDAGLLLMEAVERDPERYFSIAVHICRVVSGVPLKHSSAFFTAVSRGVIQRGVTGKGASLMFREAAAVLCALLFDLKVLKGGTPFPMANKLCKDLTAKAARLREKELLVGNNNNEEIHAGGAGVSANRGLSLGSNHSDHTLCALVTMCSNWAARNMSRETNTPEEIEFRDQIRQISRAGFGGPQILQYAEDALSDTQRRYRCGWELEELSEEESSSSDEDSFGDDDDDSSDDEEDDYLANHMDMESDDDLPLAAVDDYRKEQDHQHNLQLRQYHQLNESGGTPTTEGDDGSGQSTPRRDRSVRGAGLMFTGGHQQQSPSSPAAVTPNTSIDASFQTFNSQTPEKIGAANNNTSCDSASFSVSAGSQPTPIKTAASAVNTSGTTSLFNNTLTNANNNTYYAGTFENNNNNNNNTGGDNNNAATMAVGSGVAERLSSILNRTVYMTKVPVHLPNAVLRRVFMTFGELSKVRVYDGERSLSHEGAKYTGNQCHLPHPPPPSHPQTAASSSSPAATTTTTTTTTTSAANGDEFSVSSGGLVGGSSSSASQLPPPPPLGPPPPTGSYPPHFVAGTNVPLAVTRGSFGFVEFSSSSSAKAMVDFFRNPTVAVSKTFALGEDAEKAVLLMRVSFARSAIHDNEPHDAIIVPISAKHQRKMQKRLFEKECQKKIAAAAEKVAAAAALPAGTTRRIPAGLVLANLGGGGGATASSTSLTDAASATTQGGPTAADMVVPRSKRIKRCTFGLGGIY